MALNDPKNSKEKPTNAVSGQGEQDWLRTIRDADDLDKAFDEEEVLQNRSVMDLLRGNLSGDHEVRVLQVEPNGRLIDVSDKVKPSDLKPEDVGGIQTEDGITVPFGRSPQNREAAMRLLREMLPGLREALGSQSGRSSTSTAIRKMENVLEESDKILEHWKK